MRKNVSIAAPRPQSFCESGGVRIIIDLDGPRSGERFRARGKFRQHGTLADSTPPGMRIKRPGAQIPIVDPRQQHRDPSPAARRSRSSPRGFFALPWVHRVRVYV